MSQWQRRFWVFYLAFLVFWSIAAYGQILEEFTAGNLFAKYIDNKPYVSDFVNIYNAGLLSKRCLDKTLNKSLGEKVDIYSPEVQANSQKEVIAPVLPELPFYCQYPPNFFVSLLPLAFITLSQAYLAWIGLGLLLILAAFASYYRDEHSASFGSKLSLPLYLVLLIASYPFWLSIRLGQTSLYLLAFLVFFLKALRQRAFFTSGILASICAIKLQYGAILFFLAHSFGKLKFWLGLFAAALAWLVLCVFVLGFDNVFSYPTALINAETTGAHSGVEPYLMQNLRGQAYLLFLSGQMQQKVIAVFGFIFSFVLCAYLWRRYYFAFASGTEDALNWKSSSLKLLMASSLILLLVGSMHTHIQDYVIFVLALFLISDGVHLLDQEKFGKAKQNAQMFLLSFVPLSWFFLITKPLLFLLHVQPYFLYAIAVLVFVIGLLESMRKNYST